MLHPLATANANTCRAAQYLVLGFEQAERTGSQQPGVGIVAELFAARRTVVGEHCQTAAPEDDV